MNTHKRNRMTLGMFNFIKGIGMIGIVMGHVQSDYVLTLPILLIILAVFSRGLMPMFFMISGIGFRNSRNFRHIKKDVRDMLVPYLITMAAVAVLFPLVHYMVFRWWPGTAEETFRIFLTFLFGCPHSGKCIWGVPLYECTPMWYLLSLFWASTLLTLFYKFLGNKKRNLAVMICVILGWFFAVTDIFWYWCVPQGMMAVGFLQIGYVIKERWWMAGKLEKKIILLVVVLAAAELFLGNFNMAHADFAWGVLDYAGAGCIGFLLILFGKRADRIGGFVFEAIRKIGRYTYWIMCFHAVETNCIPWYLWAQRFEDHPQTGFFLELFIRMALLGGCCMAADRLYRAMRKGKEMGQNVQKRIPEKGIGSVSK